jgi:hypothetical protein
MGRPAGPALERALGARAAAAAGDYGPAEAAAVLWGVAALPGRGGPARVALVHAMGARAAALEGEMRTADARAVRWAIRALMAAPGPGIDSDEPEQDSAAPALPVEPEGQAWSGRVAPRLAVCGSAGPAGVCLGRRIVSA